MIAKPPPEKTNPEGGRLDGVATTEPKYGLHEGSPIQPTIEQVYYDQ